MASHAERFMALPDEFGADGQADVPTPDDQDAHDGIEPRRHGDTKARFGVPVGVRVPRM
jgi:hypothetical protein